MKKKTTNRYKSWFWTQMPELLSLYLSPANPDGVEPAPNSTLVNDSENIKFSITPGKTYRLRIINVSNMASNFVQLMGHEMTVIAVDSVNVEPATTESIYIATAQRYDVLFTAKPTATQNYFFISSLDQSMYGGYFDIAIPNAYGYLVYNPLLPLPTVYEPASFDPIDDFGLVPYDKQLILGPVSQTITINMIFENDDYDINRLVRKASPCIVECSLHRATINGQTYVPPIVPTLYTVLSAPSSDVLNPKIYGIGSNPFVVTYNDM
jgi:iron transport multicopper oxidase